MSPHTANNERKFGEAIHRYHTAKGFFQSAIMLNRSPLCDAEARESLTLLSKHLLTGFALELYFKAWLLGSGLSSQKVRNFGHDLNDLYQAVKAAGFPEIANLDVLVERIADGHESVDDDKNKKYKHRYLEDGDELQGINWEPAFVVLDKLDDAVDAKVGASASMGLAPGH